MNNEELNEVYTNDRSGKIIFNYKFNSNEQKISAEFLKKFIIAFSNSATNKYFRNNKTHYFTRSETKCYPIVDDILNSINFSNEYRVKRVYRESGYGRLDYLLRYNNYLIALELKLSHKGYNRLSMNIIQKKSIKKLDKVVKQCKGMALDEFPNYSENIKGIIPISLWFIVFYSSSDSLEKATKKIHEIENARRIVKMNMNLFNLGETSDDFEFNESPNFKSMWFLDENILLSKHHKKKNKYAVYPSLSSIAITFPLISV
jgi:hypothetical protein